ELAGLLQRIAVATVAPPDDDDPHRKLIERPATGILPEDLQAGYQIALHGRRDLPLAPDPATGFTRTLLRLLAFRAADAGAGEAAAPPSGGRGGVARSTRTPAAGAAPGPAAVPTTPARAAPPPASAAAPSAPAARAPTPPARSGAAPVAPAQPAPAVADAEPDIGPEPPPDFDEAGGGETRPGRAPATFDGDWPALARRLPVTGIAREFMHQSELVAATGLDFTVRVPIRALAAAGTVARARAALAEAFGAEVRLSVETGKVEGPTAVAIAR